MSSALPPDSSPHPLPGEAEALEARMLSDELLSHWSAPSENRLRPIAIAAAAGLLRRFGEMKLLDPALLLTIERSRERKPSAAAMFDELEQDVALLRHAYHRPEGRESALRVAATAYRIATEGDAGGNVSGAVASADTPSGLSVRQQLALKKMLDAMRSPSQMQRAWGDDPKGMRESLQVLHQLAGAPTAATPLLKDAATTQSNERAA